MANNRRKLNAIHSIYVEGAFFSDTSSVKGAIVNFYDKLYHEHHPGRPLLEGISYEPISSVDACDLVNEFSEEVWNAINDLGKEKARLERLQCCFFQHCWSIVKGEIMGLFSEL